ncbi:glycosyltransferase [Rhodohalobacter sp. SW132]|nr:glycosyltransferase [Rhodohalobacter sp. SW132]
MKISVVIPVLNEEEMIGGLIRELRVRSSTPLHEIIVVDGGSSDLTVKTAAAAGAKVIGSPVRGRAAQMNAGARAASGDILYFLHADTLPPARYDQLIRHALSVRSKAGCFRLRFTGNHPALRFYSWFTRFKSTLFRFGDQSLFIERPLFEKIGGFDEGLIVMEDQEIVRRIRQKTDFKIIKEPVTTSSRKYEQEGVYRLQFIFMIVFTLYYFGARQETLLHLYKTLMKRVL